MMILSSVKFKSIALFPETNLKLSSLLLLERWSMLATGKVVHFYMERKP